MWKYLVGAGAVLILLCSSIGFLGGREAACSGSQAALRELALSQAASCAAGAVDSQPAPQRATAASKKGENSMLEKIHLLGHDCFRIDAAKTVYFDPFQLDPGAVPADVIFISHDHHDHCSPEAVSIIAKKGTVIVTDAACAKKFSQTVKIVKPGDKLTVEGMSVEVVPAYNIDPSRLQFHPRSAGGLGFIVTIDGTRIYHAGDTDFIPEMKNLKVDIAFIPVSGKYVMTAEEAAKAIQAIKPKITIPMHYGSIVGSAKDAETLKKLVAPMRVEILKSEKK